MCPWKQRRAKGKKYENSVYKYLLLSSGSFLPFSFNFSSTFLMFSSFLAFFFNFCHPIPFHLSHFHFFFPLYSSVHTSYLSITLVSSVSCVIFDKFFYSWNPSTSQLPLNFIQFLLLTILQYSTNLRPR